MRILLFHPDSILCSWNLSGGIAAVLRRMNHEVKAIAIPPQEELSEGAIAHIASQLPPHEQLKNWDLAIVSGPEHIGPWIRHFYGDTWRDAEIIKAAWYHESFFREDRTYDFDGINETCRCDEHFFPAYQDADFHDQNHFGFAGHVHWLPFGVDEAVFSPTSEFWKSQHAKGLFDPHREWRESQRQYDVSFIGSIYPKRSTFLNRLDKHHPPVIRIGNCIVQDLRGLCVEESQHLYAENLRQTKIFLALPSLSQLIVPKIYEVMACGACVFMPSLEDSAARNLPNDGSIFMGGKHAIIYGPQHVGFVAQRLRELVEDDKTRSEIAAEGCREVHANHRLEQRLDKMLKTCCANMKVTVQ